MVKSKDAVVHYSFRVDGATIYAPSAIPEGVLNKSLVELGRILQILRRYHLLHVGNVSISRSHLKKGAVTIAYQDDDIQELLSELRHFLLTHENSGYLILTGLTKVLVHEGNDLQLYGVFKVYYYLTTGKLDISIFIDPWVPIDLNNQLQIEMAELNAPRLEAALCEINEGLFNDVYPGADEAVWEDQLGQKGFKVLINNDLKGFGEVSDLQRKLIEKYLWVNYT